MIEKGPEGVRPLAPLAPARLGQGSVHQEVGRLHGHRDPAPGGPGEIIRVDALEVLDAVGKVRPGGVLQEVERETHGGVPDRVDGAGEAGLRRHPDRRHGASACAVMGMPQSRPSS